MRRASVFAERTVPEESTSKKPMDVGTHPSRSAFALDELSTGCAESDRRGACSGGAPTSDEIATISRLRLQERRTPAARSGIDLFAIGPWESFRSRLVFRRGFVNSARLSGFACWGDAGADRAAYLFCGCLG